MRSLLKTFQQTSQQTNASDHSVALFSLASLLVGPIQTQLKPAGLLTAILFGYVMGMPQANAQTATTPNLPAASASLVRGKALIERLDGLDLTGNTVFSNETLLASIQDFLGKPVYASDIEEMRLRLTAKYIDAGFINSGAIFVMPHEAMTNRLQFRIVEGQLKEVHAQSLDGLRASYLERRLRQSGEVFNINLLRERFQLLLQDPLFERIQSRLLPSTTLGQAVLDLEVTRKPAYSWAVFSNNYRTPAIGEALVGAALTARNLSGSGDILDLQIAKSSGAAPYHFAWTLPLENPAHALSLSWDAGRSSVVEAPLDTIDIHSRTSALELKWNYTPINRLERRVDLGVSYLRKFTHNTLLGEDFSFSPGEVNGRSSVQAIRLTQELSERGSHFGWQTRSAFQFGRTNHLPFDAEATQGGNISAQHDLPSQHYIVWNLQSSYLRPLGYGGLNLLARAQWQWSNARLLPMEKASLGGAATIRGLRESSLLRDQSQLLSFELQKPIVQETQASKPWQLTPVLFVDMGRAQNKAESWVPVQTAGVGVKWQNGPWSGEMNFARQWHASAQLASPAKQALQDRGLQLQVMYKFN